MHLSPSKLFYPLVSIMAVGLPVSSFLAAATIWYTLNYEATNQVAWRSWADMRYAYGSGPVENRWVVDSERLSFGVRVGTLTDYTGFDSTQSYKADERSGAKTIPHWSRGRTRPQPGNRFDRIYEIAGGFPFVSWKGEVRVETATNKTEAWCSFQPTISPQHRYPITIPYCPVLPDGLLNAAFWGAALLVPLHAARALRTRVRRIWRTRHHRCPNCAYDIQSLPTCPECGEPVKAKPING